MIRRLLCLLVPANKKSNQNTPLWLGLVLCSFAFCGFAQTTLIAAGGDGGFESGTTFAANGWTVTNGGANNANQWVCNTGATAGFSGVRAAYVSSTRNGTPPHTYINSTTRVSHIYRDITVPAGEDQIDLDFDWICDGETIFDWMRIWLVPTTYTPTYGTQITALGAVPTGRIQVGGNFSEQYTWNAANLSLPAGYGGQTFRIVFEWRNDGSLGGNPPIGIDNISLISDSLSSYCTPAPTSVDGNGITNVTYSTVNNTTGAEAGNYGDYSALVGTGVEGAVLPIDITYQTGYTYDTTIWVDWNDDFVFSAGEVAYTGVSTAANPTTLNASITIPIGTAGTHRMRIGGMDFGPMTDPCYTGSYACFEDYSLLITVGAPCTTPSAQPTNLVFTNVTNNAIDGSFDAAIPAASNYLVLMNTTGTTPTAPTDGVSYPIGDTSLGATVIDDGSDLVFSATALAANTTYYFFIYSFNDSGCTGGPLYNTVNPLNDNTTTDFYCAPSPSSVDGIGITNVTFSTVNNTTGAEPNNYGNYSAMVGTAQEGDILTVNITYETGFTYDTTIWVDWNDDGDFIDAGEEVYTGVSTAANPTTLVATFMVPGGTAGTHRMRIGGMDFGPMTDPCYTGTYACFEDYSLLITPLNCTDDPISVTALATSDTTGTISWTAPAPAPANGYIYTVSTDNSTSTPGDDIAHNVTTTATSINLTGLTVGVTYYVFVRSDCGGGDLGIWIAVTFDTCGIIDNTPNYCGMIIDQVGTDPFAIDPFVSDPTYTIDCTTNSIELATNAQMFETTSYEVVEIPYQYIGSLGATITNSTISNDDLWADFTSPLGFPFCFYDNEYTETLLGANSMITFVYDTDINTAIPTPGDSCGWEFANDLPYVGTDPDYFVDDALFAQTIYGVYHDIYPVGLPADAISYRTQGIAGCRLFIAEWKDIPMFSDSTRFYSGMIVLYETTNIIEVYIEEKRIENGNVAPVWNDGNALVGLQGANVDNNPSNPANEFIVAPCRNSLDTNWEVTNEAWRFVPNGNSRLTGVEWYIGTNTSGTPDATTNTYTVTTPGTYTAVSTYSTCGGSTVELTDQIVITDGRKTWNGSVDSNWFEDNNWTPTGEPTLNDCVVIPDATTTPNDPIADQADAPTATTPAEAGTVTVESGAYLEIDTNAELVVREWVNVENTGIFNLKSSASLIQIEDTAVNTGDIHVQRSPNFDESAVGGTEYVYWSSPVNNFPVTSISPSSNLIYRWNPTNPANGVGGHGEWLYSNGSMNDATGYIVRGLGGTPGTIPATAYTIPNNTALFSGVPNNGVITKAISHGNYNGGDYPGNGNTATNQDDNWNLIGNPYPSAISANAFVDFNTNINGTVYVWPHSSTYSAATDDPFYEDFGYNYDGNDYIEHNNLGSNPPGTNDLYIGSGQGFFVLMNHSATSGTNLTFNNSMRFDTALEVLLNNYDNSNFYRNSTSGNSSESLEKHRIWLDLLSPNDVTNSILVGYATNATNDFDRLFDGYDFKSDVSGFYSIIGEHELSIQGRALPFLESDEVPLGLVANATGSHTIAIHSIDGLFLEENRNIYLEDLEQNIIHDLKHAPYTFTITQGLHNDRFILRYSDDTLGVSDYNLHGLSIIAPNGEYVKVTSDRSNIKSIIIYDLLGRVLFNNNSINKTQFRINKNNLANGAYLVKVTLENGQSKIQKVVLKD